MRENFSLSTMWCSNDSINRPFLAFSSLQEQVETLIDDFLVGEPKWCQIPTTLKLFSICIFANCAISCISISLIKPLSLSQGWQDPAKKHVCICQGWKPSLHISSVHVRLALFRFLDVVTHWFFRKENCGDFLRSCFALFCCERLRYLFLLFSKTEKELLLSALLLLVFGRIVYKTISVFKRNFRKAKFLGCRYPRTRK